MAVQCEPRQSSPAWNLVSLPPNILKSSRQLSCFLFSLVGSFWKLIKGFFFFMRRDESYYLPRLVFMQNKALTSKRIRNTLFWAKYEETWHRNRDSDCPKWYVPTGVWLHELLWSQNKRNSKSSHLPIMLMRTPGSWVIAKWRENADIICWQS